MIRQRELKSAWDAQQKARDLEHEPKVQEYLEAQAAAKKLNGEIRERVKRGETPEEGGYELKVTTSTRVEWQKFWQGMLSISAVAKAVGASKPAQSLLGAVTRKDVKSEFITRVTSVEVIQIA